MSKSTRNNSKNGEFTHGKKGNSATREAFRNDGASSKRSGQNVAGRRIGNYDCVDSARAVRSSANDIKWYSRNPQLLKDAGQLSFSNALGLGYKTAVSANPEYNVLDFGQEVIPGIMKLSLVPGFGISKDAFSAVNVNSRLLYSFIRHANSGSRNYEAPDLMTYVLAMSSCYAWHAEMARLYGLFRVYSKMNRYISKPLIEALGYDFDSINANLASFRYLINSFAVKLNSFAVPKELMIFDRHAFVPSHVWKDAGDDKSQLYVMQYEYYYRWTGTQFETGSALVPFSPYSLQEGNLLTFETIAAFTDGLVTGLMANEDIGIMSGDILKAFGESGLREVKGIDENYSVLPEYDEVLLAQIHNAYSPGRLAYTDRPVGMDNETFETVYNDTCVTQENGYLKWNPPFVNNSAGIIPIEIIDAGFDNPDPTFLAEATRLHSTADIVWETLSGEDADPNIGLGRFAACGTEILNHITLYTCVAATGTLDAVDLPQVDSFTWSSSAELAQKWQRVRHFDWAPYAFLVGDVYSDPVNAQLTPVYVPCGEVFNFTIPGFDYFTKLHDVCLLSLLEVPGMAHSV